MSDDTQQTIVPAAIPSPVPATTPTLVGDEASAKKPAGDQPNPLDVLEKLLDEIDGGKSGVKPGEKDLGKKGQAGQDNKPVGPTPEEIAAKKLEEQRLEYEKIKAEHLVIDKQKIKEQRQALEGEMQSGEANVARAQQDEEKEKASQNKETADDGYEVVQLDHTKI